MGTEYKYGRSLSTDLLLNVDQAFVVLHLQHIPSIGKAIET